MRGHSERQARFTRPRKAVRNKPGVALLLCCLASAATPLVRAQVGQQALTGLQNRPDVVVSVSQRVFDVTAALDVHVRVSNLTERDIFLKEVRVSLPGDFLASRGDPLPDSAILYLPSGDEQMTAGTERFMSFAIPHQDIAWYSPIFNRRLLMFFPGEYDLTTFVKYQVPPARDTQIQQVIDVRLEPPLSSVVWGGVVGALLLGAFSGTYRYRRLGNTTLRRVLAETSVIVIGGSVCSLIALILLHRVKELALPINLSVTDFYGGIVLGLFSYKIGDYLFSQLFGNADDK